MTMQTNTFDVSPSDARSRDRLMMSEHGAMSDLEQGGDDVASPKHPMLNTCSVTDLAAEPSPVARVSPVVGVQGATSRLAFGIGYGSGHVGSHDIENDLNQQASQPAASATVTKGLFARQRFSLPNPVGIT